MARGTASVHGIGGTLLYSGLLSNENKLVGGSVGDEFSVAELRDGNNNVIGAFASGRRRTCTFEVIVLGTTEADAKTNVVLPEPLAVVSISGVNPIVDNDWNYVGGGSIAMSTDGYWRVTLPCARYDQTGSSTPSALAVTT